MISAEDARYIVRDLDAEKIIRRCWRAAGPETNAAVVLCMAAGKLVIHTWSPALIPPVEPDSEILLAMCPAARYAETVRLAGRYSEVRPSAEVVEEEAVRAQPEHVVRDFAVEPQLRRFEALQSRSAAGR